MKYKMSENKSYAMLVDSEETIKHTIIFAIFSFLFFIIFFNNVPETSLEIAIDKILIKNIGYYSHTYPFQSQIISNEVLWLTPPLSLYVSLKSKIIHLSIEELKQKNLYICTSIYRKLTRVIFFLIFSFLSFLILETLVKVKFLISPLLSTLKTIRAFLFEKTLKLSICCSKMTSFFVEL